MKKTIEVKGATSSFAMFLIAMNVKFTYDYGSFYIHDTLDIDKFRVFCDRNGVREIELEEMTMEVVELD